jgi:hypothetical protein
VSNSLIALDVTQLPSTEIAADYNSLSQGADYLGRLQLFAKGKAVDKGLIGPGHWGIPVSDDEVIDLGKEIDVLPLARRPKAMDFSDKEAILTNYDQGSDEFQRIAAQSNEKDSGCMYGPSYLVFERSSGRFLEYFCGSKSSRQESKNITPFLLTVKDGKQEGPHPMTLKTRYVEKTKYPYHVPVVTKCSTPITNLPADKVAQEINKFLNPKSDEVEVVDDSKTKKRAR